jgi:hypothetical protein
VIKLGDVLARAGEELRDQSFGARSQIDSRQVLALARALVDEVNAELESIRGALAPATEQRLADDAGDAAELAALERDETRDAQQRRDPMRGVA